MIEALAALMRIAFARTMGRKPPISALRRCISIAVEDYYRLGPASEERPLLSPEFSADEMAIITLRALRRTVANAVKFVPAYQHLAVNPGNLTLSDFSRIPPTTRHELVSDPSSYYNHACKELTFLQRSSGTSGGPRAEMLYSKYELEHRALTAAANGLVRGLLSPADVTVSFLPLTALVDTYLLQEMNRAVGSLCLTYGVVSPDQAVQILTSPVNAPHHRSLPSLMFAETTHIVAMALSARKRGLGPDDFALTRIFAGGELLVPTYKELIINTFGAPIDMAYSSSEITPAFAQLCSESNYHVDEQGGYFELLDPGTGRPVDTEPGVLVVTPFYPLREGMPLLRYWTSDLAVRVEHCPCGMAQSAGVFRLLGREHFSVQLADGIITQYEIVAALSGVCGVELPVRCHAEVINDELIVDVSVCDDGPDVITSIQGALEAIVPGAKINPHTDHNFNYYPLRWERHLADRRQGG